jgi:hypothetical protein
MCIFFFFILILIIHRKCSKQAQPNARLPVLLLLRAHQMAVQRRKLRTLIVCMIMVVIKI